MLSCWQQAHAAMTMKKNGRMVDKSESALLINSREGRHMVNEGETRCMTNKEERRRLADKGEGGQVVNKERAGPAGARLTRERTTWQCSKVKVKGLK